MDETVQAAQDAWGRGDYLEVRSLLEPVADAGPVGDAAQRERVLLLLADAILSDATFPRDDRQVRAAALLERIMDNEGGWRLPRKVYSPELYDLYLNVRERRISEAGSQCEADRLACEADADAADARLRQTQNALDDLQVRYETQEIAVGEKRTRALALFPLGISHFLNGDRAIGATFLVAEAAFGLAGLSLIIVRATVDGCRRTRSFQAGSLVCNPRANSSEQDVVRRRQTEEAMGWLFIGSIVTDIVLAQLRFKEFEITGTRPRSEVEAPSGRKRTKKRRATVTPRAGASRLGGSLGVEVHF